MPLKDVCVRWVSSNAIIPKNLICKKNEWKYMNYMYLSIFFPFQYSEVASGSVPCKKVFLKISPNLQENTCARVWHRCFLVNFLKILKASFSENTSGWLLLNTARLRRDWSTYPNDYKKTRKFHRKMCFYVEMICLSVNYV